ncbi:MAG: PepSY-associated TM helix domain-containing protein [Cyanobacteria bacterium P01_E01_bin.42]
MMKQRNWILKVHGYVGVVIGLLVAIIGLTGSILVFSEPLGHALSPSSLAIAPQGALRPVDEIVATAKQAVPDGILEFMSFPDEPNKPYNLSMESSDDKHLRIYIHPYTGSILGLWHPERSFMSFVVKLHAHLLAGEVGEIAVGVSSFLLLGLSITGFILWPGWRKLSAGYKIRWQSARKILYYDLHKVAGIVMGIFLALVSFTGVIIFLLHVFPKAIVFFTGPPPPPVEMAALPANSVPLPLSQLLKKANEAMPGSQTTGVSFPHGEGEEARKMTIRRKFPNDPFVFGGLSHVDLDVYTGQVLGLQKVDKPTWGTRFGNFIVGFHFGTFAGLPSQILYVFVGMTPTLLFGTGFVLWQQRRWAESRKREKKNLLQKAIAIKKELQEQQPQAAYSENALPANSPKATQPKIRKKPRLTLGIEAIDGDSLDDLIHSLGLVIPPEGFPEKFDT